MLEVFSSNISFSMVLIYLVGKASMVASAIAGSNSGIFFGRLCVCACVYRCGASFPCVDKLALLKLPMDQIIGHRI